MPTACIALGGNIGDVQRTFQFAAEMIGGLDRVQNVVTSAVYRTEPVGVQAGESFLNAVLRCDIEMEPEELLDRLQEIETRLGRVRTVHWGPRVIDLDLLAVDQQVVDTLRLKLPHPAIWMRRFVLDPLCDVAPDWRHPVLNTTANGLRQRLLVRPLPVLFSGRATHMLAEVCETFGRLVQVSSNIAGQESQVVIGDDQPSPFRLELSEGSPEELLQTVQQILRGVLDDPVRCSNLNLP